MPNSPKRVFLHYLGEHKLSTFHVQRLTLVLFPRSFFVLQANVVYFCKKNVKIGLQNEKKLYTYFWIPLPYSKPRNWCNKGSRSHGWHEIQKVKKIMSLSEALTKLDNVSKKCQDCLTWAFTQASSVGIEKKSFVEKKSVSVDKHVKIWQFVFTKVV